MIITRTPLRLSLLGGNTDFREYYLKYGGFVLSTSIDKYVYCIVKKRFDDLIVVNYTRKEVVKKVSQIKHELVREAMKLTGVSKGIEISFLADIPGRGTGLGSSSAVTIGVLNALHTYMGESVNSRELAEEAIKIELDILKKPIGVQDQFIIAYGGLRYFDLKSGGLIVNKKLNLTDNLREEFENSLMLFYSGITRKSDEILSSVDFSKNKKLLDQNKKLAHLGVRTLERGDLESFGKLLDRYWQLKKTLSDKISNGSIENMYRLAMAAGASGCKVVGAGGGGFLLVMSSPLMKKSIKNALKGFKEMPFSFSDSPSMVIFNSYK